MRTISRIPSRAATRLLAAVVGLGLSVGAMGPARAAVENKQRVRYFEGRLPGSKEILLFRASPERTRMRGELGCLDGFFKMGHPGKLEPTLFRTTKVIAGPGGHTVRANGVHDVALISPGPVGNATISLVELAKAFGRSPRAGETFHGDAGLVKEVRKYRSLEALEADIPSVVVLEEIGPRRFEAAHRAPDLPPEVLRLDDKRRPSRKPSRSGVSPIGGGRAAANGGSWGDLGWDR